MCWRGFQLARVKRDRDGKGGSKATGVENLNIWGGSEQKLARFKKSSSHFKTIFQYYLLSGISNTSIFKVRHVLHSVNFLLIKTFSNIFPSTFRWGGQYFNKFYIPFIFYYCQQVLLILSVSSLLSPLNDESVDEGSF